MKTMKLNFLMKTLPALLLMPVILAACSAGYDSSGRVEVNLPATSGGAPAGGNPVDVILTGSGGGTADPTKAGGGVDVGNLTTYMVPTTQVALTAGQEWAQSPDASKLNLTSKDQSTITAQTQQIASLVSPSMKSLELYLVEKYPKLKLSHRTLNGTAALELVSQDNDEGLKSNIFLINDGKNVVNIKADLKKDSLVSGKEVLASTRILYEGEALSGQLPKTVVLENRSYNPTSKNYYYSMTSDCFAMLDRKCGNVVSMTFEGKEPYRTLQMGAAGYDTGHFVELGRQTEVPFESIRIEGAFLVAKGDNVPLANIYSLFTPQNLSQEMNRINPKEGMVYLVRSISWPTEDVIFKMRVDSVSDTSMTMTYERLTKIPETTLKARVASAIEYTLKNETPKDRGEVVLYSRSFYGAYSFAAFNFRYSTSGNHWITNNGWDLLFDGGNLRASSTGSGFARMSVLTTKTDLGLVSRSDFPNANLPAADDDRGYEVRKGQIYLIEHYNYDAKDGHTLGAVKILDVDKDGKWVRIEFLRIVVEDAKDFVNWQPLQVLPDVVSVTLESGRAGSYNPFDRVRSDIKAYYQESIEFEVDSGDGEDNSIRVDSRPYKGRGFRKIDPKLFTNVNLTDARKLVAGVGGNNDQPVKKGDVVLGELKTYYSHIILLIRVDEIVAGKSMSISVRDLYKAKAPYENELNTSKATK